MNLLTTFLIIQKKLEPISSSHTKNSHSYQYDLGGSVWLEVFHIFLNVVIPILIFLSVYYFLFKFLGVFKEFSSSIKKIADSMENKD